MTLAGAKLIFMKNLTELKNRIAKLKELEDYYDNLLVSSYRTKQLRKIHKEQHSIREKIKSLGENPLY